MNRGRATVDFDAVVVGAGMVGAATAALLSRAGFSVAVIERAEPEPFDVSSEVGLRVSAISPGSADVLAEAGGWRLIERSRHCHYRRMQVEDRDESVRIDFEAAEFALERLGTIVENDLVQWSLWQALLVSSGIEILCPARVEAVSLEQGDPRLTLDDGTQLTTRLLVGADGANSRIRQELGIEQEFWEYGQLGIVAVVESEEPNPGIAWQRFGEGGPVAFLPLQDGRSSIVWSQGEAEVRRLLALDDTEFLSELQYAVSGTEGHWPGELVACGPRSAFPLTMRLSRQYVCGQAALVGDAAHVVHPLAGQGVNLGLLDAAGLVEVMVAARNDGQDPVTEAVLQKYDRWRRSEAEVMARGIHGIRGLFMPEELNLLRRLGLGLVGRSWLAREAFIRRATGRNNGAPALARGESLAQLVHSA